MLQRRIKINLLDISYRTEMHGAENLNEERSTIYSQSELMQFNDDLRSYEDSEQYPEFDDYFYKTNDRVLQFGDVNTTNYDNQTTLVRYVQSHPKASIRGW